MTKISFYTFGCRLNQSETSSIENSFTTKGYSVVDFEEPADIVVVNTCTVTEGGDSDTRRLVNKINRRYPSARIALVGCQAQVQKEQLADLPNVRWIVGNARKMELPEVFAEYPQPSQAQLVTPTIERKPFMQSVDITGIDPRHTRANLKIQDGCDFFCTFCEIPYARGRARSRVFDDVMVEAKALAIAGHQEIVLTGINIGTYADSGYGLLDVVNGLNAMDGVRRIRISSIEPTTVNEALFDRMNDSKLCRYLHLPIQSGDDEILSLMGRKYTTEQYLGFINRAHQKVSHLCVGTDVIVGYPGETDAHFDRTVDLLRDAPIHYFHVFSYSPRHMAKSRLEENISSHIITHRSQVLRELSARKRRLYYTGLVGQTCDVLFEEEKNGHWTGFTDTYVRVFVKSHESLYNQMRLVRLSTVTEQGMTGEVVHD